MHPDASTPPDVYNSEVDDQDKTLTERLEQDIEILKQRRRLGWPIALIVLILPIVMLVLLWLFILYPPKHITLDTTLIAVIFSATHIAVIALYVALISGVFKKISTHDDEKEQGNTSVLKHVVSFSDAMRESITKRD